MHLLVILVISLTVSSSFMLATLVHFLFQKHANINLKNGVILCDNCELTGYNSFRKIKISTIHPLVPSQFAVRSIGH